MVRARARSVRRFLFWVVVSWALLAAGTLVASAVQAFRGSEALDDLRSPDELADVLDEAPSLRAAADRWRSASGLVGSPVLAPIRMAPVVGAQLDGLRTVVGAGADVVDRAAEAAERLSRAADVDNGPERLALLEVAAREIRGVRRTAASVDLGSRAGLLWPVRPVHDRAAGELEELDRALADAARAARTVRRLAEGPTTYLVLAANNAEMRVGSGMFLSAGILEIRGGRAQLSEMEPAGQLVAHDAVPLPPQMEDLWGWAHPGRDLRSLALSPRFPQSAATAAAIWEASGRPAVDGVVALDVVAMGELLSVTGAVDAGGRRVDADTVVEHLLVGQYVGTRTATDTAARREELAVIARAVVGAVDAGRVDAAELAEALQRAARGRHVMAWSSDPGVQRVWQDVGLAGVLTPRSVLLGVANADASKLDQFVVVRAALDAETGRDGSTFIDLHVVMTNDAPRDAPPYVVGPDGRRDYAGVFVAYLPGAAEGISVGGGGSIVARGRDGPSQVIAVNVDLPPGEPSTVTVRFRLGPDVAVRLVLEPGARVPAVRWRIDGKPIDERGAPHPVEFAQDWTRAGGREVPFPHKAH